MTPLQAAAALVAEIAALPRRDTASIRAVRQARTKAWARQPVDFILEVARALAARHAGRWVGEELIRFHRPAFAAFDDTLAAELAQGLDSWDTVDAYARILVGPAWARGQVSDGLIDTWSRSPDRWLRRAALVSTVALNRPAEGGRIDAPRTLAICARLAGDRDDMVEKAVSWALRELGRQDAAPVEAFLADNIVGARVRREVGNKLRTGLKNPKSD
ncbi:3-methyladenine DNA glycosylase AlkD [Caulobacter ginsengisoli]|uniref:3-methyladenine DNA glycosylase AlkD n=1 Tax=Caulobacter ginsengisoli TaxID=400775 RepID=A0ABU0IKL4_9CAUL|nr:DNA alkylation repair protein [Caulobacter ginsengisoli]MDQ0462548.1 3-methyladenine DNA glycosylase AlkD [Caulobacter ginsengisoli]